MGMADVKWIKIVTDIFDDEKVLLIESMPSPDSIIVIWFKLLCLAGRQNNSGVIMMNERIAYTDEMLATVFRRDVNTVRMALKVFEQFDMIRIVDGVITIPNWGKHQNLDQLERKKEYQRKYMRGYREKQKLLTAGENETICKANSESHVSRADKEEDKDKEGEKKKKKSVKESPHTLLQRLIPEYIMTEDLKAKMAEWITYKTERKEGYKETGLKSLLRQVENKAMEYGEPALIALIDQCMASNWKGIVFDKLAKTQPVPLPRQDAQPYRKASKAEEMNDFYNMAAEWSAESE